MIATNLKKVGSAGFSELKEVHLLACSGNAADSDYNYS